ncbi:MAG: hypothetical protein ABI120_10180 [Gemmatimonadaceae bacterium]
MRRTLAPTILLSTLFATPAFAQKPDAKSDSTIAQLTGHWEGSVYSDHAPESALKLTFARGTAFKVTVSIVSNGQEFVTAESTDLKVDGNSVSWSLGLMEQSCKGTGVLIAGALKGDFACGEHGGITYLAKKK